MLTDTRIRMIKEGITIKMLVMVEMCMGEGW
jgi:hypothetical protein